MFTIKQLCDAKILTMRVANGTEQPVRWFYETRMWQDEFVSLPAYTGPARLARDPSVQGRLAALVARYIAGDPKAELVRPRGEAMDPQFCRMDPPYQTVVEMRTQETRTFGFFCRANLFCAVTVALTSDLKLPTGRADRVKYEDRANTVMRLVKRTSSSEIDGNTDVQLLLTD